MSLAEQAYTEVDTTSAAAPAPASSTSETLAPLTTAASAKALGAKYLIEPAFSAISSAEKSLTAAKSMPTEFSESPALSKVNEAAQDMVVIKGKRKINISSDYSEKDTTTDDDSVDAMLPPVLNIVMTNPKESLMFNHSSYH